MSRYLIDQIERVPGIEVHPRTGQFEFDRAGGVPVSGESVRSST